MNAAIAAAGAAVATVSYWRIAAGAADRRCLRIGTLPPVVLALVAGTAWAAALAGTPAAGMAAISGASVAGVVDARTGSIFDPLTAAMLGTAFVLAAIAGSAVDGFSGAAGLGGALLLLRAMSGGHGLGLGDVKLGTALGMALGLAHGMSAIGLAFIFGGGYGVWLLATGRARAGAPIRFGPFIAAGTFAALLTPLGFRV